MPAGVNTPAAGSMGEEVRPCDTAGRAGEDGAAAEGRPGAPVPGEGTGGTGEGSAGSINFPGGRCGRLSRAINPGCSAASWAWYATMLSAPGKGRRTRKGRCTAPYRGVRENESSEEQAG